MKSDNSRYYEILRVRKSASEGELKKAYKLAAVKLHPDKGGDLEKFKELFQAYEVLNDPKKRDIYDQYGEDALKEGMGGGGDDGSDPFGDVFDSLSGGNHPSGALRSQDGSAFAEDHHEGDESSAEGVDGAAEEVDEAAEVGDEAEYRGYTGSSDSEDGPERVVQLTQRSSKLSWIAKTLFLVQALGLVAIVAGIMIYERLGLLPGIKIYHTPLVFSILTSCTVALCVLHSIVECPSSLVTLFQWAPSCCLVTGFHLLTGGTNASIGYFFLTIGFAFTAYVCHKYRSLTRGAKLVTAAIKVSKLSGRIFKAVYLSLAVGGLVCCLCTIALSAPVSKPLVYRIVLIASLMWCMEVIHNVMVVAICRVMYLEINGSLPRYGKTILGKVLRESLGEVALAALVPMLRAACSAVRLLSLLVPSATQLVHWLDWCWRHYSLWGLAAVGLHRMTIFRGSFHMYKLFESKQTLRRVRSDVTESLSLLWSLFGGSVGASVAGGMVNLSVGIKDITMIMIYGFLLGFQLTRVVMSWPTGAVIAYHVRNAERVNLSEQQLALNMEAGSRNQIGLEAA